MYECIFILLMKWFSMSFDPAKVESLVCKQMKQVVSSEIGYYLDFNRVFGAFGRRLCGIFL